jgi:photosystem II stability/assembly factor-like uncharacterized protein
MYRVCLLLPLFFLLVLVVGCEAPGYKPMKWNKLAVPTSETLTGIYFLNEKHGFAVTEVGSILETTDGGQSFVILDYRTGTRLEDVYFLSGDDGFVFGKDGLLAMTEDGGENWRELLTDDSYWFYDMAFLGDNHGFLAGVLSSPEYQRRGFIGFSADEGETWSFDTTDFYGFSHIDILEPTHAWIAGIGHIMYTIDRGETWEHTATGNLRDIVRSVFFANMQYGYCVGEKGLIQVTTDGGWSWQRTEKFTERDFTCVTAPEINLAYIAGDGVIGRSTNRGTTWEIDSTSYDSYFHDVYWDDNWVYLCGSGGALLKVGE